MMKSIRLFFYFESEERFNLWELGKLGDIASDRQLRSVQGSILSSTTSEDGKIKGEKA
jgi:hypothetical protein